MRALLVISIVLVSFAGAGAQNTQTPESCSAAQLNADIARRIGQYQIQAERTDGWADAVGAAQALTTDVMRILMDCGQAAVLLSPSSDPTRTIGIVAGHNGPSQRGRIDAGASCEDGLTEAEVTFDIAVEVAKALRRQGYVVLLLDEFDSRLQRLQAAAVVSIHSGDCRDYGVPVTGFLVDNVASRPDGGPDDDLAECIGRRYRQATGLDRRFGHTLHMTDFHRFDELDALTPAVVLELGFLLADREILTNRQDEVAQGIATGILCFVQPVLAPEMTPEATAEALQ